MTAELKNSENSVERFGKKPYDLYLQYYKESKEANLNMAPLAFLLSVGASMAFCAAAGNENFKETITSTNFLILYGVAVTASVPFAIGSINSDKKLKELAYKIARIEGVDYPNHDDLSKIKGIVDAAEGVMPGSILVDEDVERFLDRRIGAQSYEGRVRERKEEQIKLGFGGLKKSAISDSGNDEVRRRNCYRSALELVIYAWNEELKITDDIPQRKIIARTIINSANWRLHKTHPIIRNIEWNRL